MSVALVASSRMTVEVLLKEQIRFLLSEGIDVRVFCGGDDRDAGQSVCASILPFSRRVSVFRDLYSLLVLTCRLVRLPPEVLQTHSPKAGLLGMVAGWIARVPVRIYTVNGLVFETQRGYWRRVLIGFEKLACGLATNVICVSRSVAEVVRSEGVAGHAKVVVLGNGSSHGVEVRRFSPPLDSGRARGELRAECGVPSEAVVIGYVGRFSRDKGVDVLARAWSALRPIHPTLHLVLCGARDTRDPTDEAVLESLRADSRVRFSEGFTSDPHWVYLMLDMLVLPSYREGLPNVVLEAAIAGVPTIASAVTGCVDAILHMKTGVLVEPGSVGVLAGAIESLAVDKELRESLGAAARAFVVDKFASEIVNARLLGFYSQCLAGRRQSGGNRRGHDKESH